MRPLLTKSNCLLRGMPGDYTRASAEIDWRRTFTTSNGMQITPFVQLRGDVASLDVQNQPGVANYMRPVKATLPAPCRRPVSSTVTRLSMLNRGAPRRSSRSPN